MKNRGQSLIEVVFAIGLIGLVLAGIVGLLVSTMGARSKSYERIKAAELAQSVIETLVWTKSANGGKFWDLSSSFWNGKVGVALTNPSFAGYDYRIEVIPDTTNGCTASTCMNVTVSVGWSGSPDGARDNFNRFFSRK